MFLKGVEIIPERLCPPELGNNAAGVWRRLAGYFIEKALLRSENSKAYADNNIQVCACKHRKIINPTPDRLKRPARPHKLATWVDLNHVT
jgi:hypothetical protein